MPFRPHKLDVGACFRSKVTPYSLPGSKTAQDEEATAFWDRDGEAASTAAIDFLLDQPSHATR